MKYIKIDSQGFYEGDIFLSEAPVKTQTITKTRYELIPEYDEEGVLLKEDSQPIEYFETVTVIDANGEAVLLDGFVRTECQGGLHRPKWDGSSWFEGLTSEELAERSAPVITPDMTLEDRVTASEDKIVTMEEQFDAIFGGE